MEKHIELFWWFLNFANTRVFGFRERKQTRSRWPEIWMVHDIVHDQKCILAWNHSKLYRPTVVLWNQFFDTQAACVRIKMITEIRTWKHLYIYFTVRRRNKVFPYDPWQNFEIVPNIAAILLLFILTLSGGNRASPNRKLKWNLSKIVENRQSPSL